MNEDVSFNAVNEVRDQTLTCAGTYHVRHFSSLPDRTPSADTHAPQVSPSDCKVRGTAAYL